MAKVRSLGPRINLPNFPRPSTPPKDPAIQEGDEATEASSEVSTFVTYESSSQDNSTLSSIHTDSLASFAGNLSPPEIEFLSGNVEVVFQTTGKTSILPRLKSKRHLLAMIGASHQDQRRLSGSLANSPSNEVPETAVRQQSGSSLATSRRKGRSSPASTAKSSRKSSKLRAEDEVEAKAPPAAMTRQSSHKTTEAEPGKDKKTIVTPIVSQSSSTSTPSTS